MLEVIWHDFHRQLLLFINTKVRDKAAAEDILQDVFIKVDKNLHSLQDDDKLTSWLYQICRNAINDYYRQRKPETSDVELESMIAEEAASESRVQIHRCLQQLIQDLPEKYSEVLLSSEFSDVKQTELAVRYALSLPALKSRIKRGREHLKEKLQQCCDFEFTEAGPKADCKSDCGCDG
ncbi:MAG: sigma-70 family RNA polymerase sigma factor [Pseudomonadales bacterium]|nr:sigma-70 family RNA polymerase sigma factor [Pseudomonadales bacterium]